MPFRPPQLTQVSRNGAVWYITLQGTAKRTSDSFPPKALEVHPLFICSVSSGCTISPQIYIPSDNVLLLDVIFKDLEEPWSRIGTAFVAYEVFFGGAWRPWQRSFMHHGVHRYA